MPTSKASTIVYSWPELKSTRFVLLRPPILLHHTYIRGWSDIVLPSLRHVTSTFLGKLPSTAKPAPERSTSSCSPSISQAIGISARIPYPRGDSCSALEVKLFATQPPFLSAVLSPGTLHTCLNQPRFLPRLATHCRHLAATAFWALRAPETWNTWPRNQQWRKTASDSDTHVYRIDTGYRRRQGMHALETAKHPLHSPCSSPSPTRCRTTSPHPGPQRVLQQTAEQATNMVHTEKLPRSSRNEAGSLH